jgi:tRNA(Ile)-lysidine synthase
MMLDTSLYAQIKNYCFDHKLIADGMTVVVGLSGGPDSVFLLHFLADLKKEFNLSLVAAHLNHEWRSTADNDAEFCRQLALQLGIRIVIKKGSELGYKPRYNGSKEEFGRKLRRFFFTELAKEYNAHAIALGHHADDQQETFFMRIIRGTTLTGLTCMKPIEGLYIRPLLATAKQEILDALTLNKINYCTDKTNTDQSHLRNRIRSQLIPAAKTCDERFANQFQRSLAHIQKVESFLDKLTEESFNSCSIQVNTMRSLNMEKLTALDPFLRDRVITRWLIEHKIMFPLSESFIKEINRFLFDSKKKEHQLTPLMALQREDDHITLKSRLQS